MRVRRSDLRPGLLATLAFWSLAVGLPFSSAQDPAPAGEHASGHVKVTVLYDAYQAASEEQAASQSKRSFYEAKLGEIKSATEADLRACEALKSHGDPAAGAAYDQYHSKLELLGATEYTQKLRDAMIRERRFRGETIAAGTSYVQAAFEYLELRRDVRLPPGAKAVTSYDQALKVLDRVTTLEQLPIEGLPPATPIPDVKSLVDLTVIQSYIDNLLFEEAEMENLVKNYDADVAAKVQNEAHLVKLDVADATMKLRAEGMLRPLKERIGHLERASEEARKRVSDDRKLVDALRERKNELEAALTPAPPH